MSLRVFGNPASDPQGAVDVAGNTHNTYFCWHQFYPTDELDAATAIESFNDKGAKNETHKLRSAETDPTHNSLSLSLSFKSQRSSGRQLLMELLVVEVVSFVAGGWLTHWCHEA